MKKYIVYKKKEKSIWQLIGKIYKYLNHVYKYIQIDNFLNISLSL